MRVTEHQLRRIIREVTMEDIFGKKVKSLDDVETVGDLKKLIKYAQSAKRAEKGKEAGEEWAKSTLWDETFGKIPGLSAAKNAADALKSMYDLPDEARTGTALDHMDVDDDVAKIVDDPIENDFLKALGDEIDGMNDDLPMSNLNVTQGLANYMGKKFNARTVAGFTEARRVRITQRQLRRIIREQLTETIEKLANGKFRLYSKKKDPKTGDRKNLGTYDSREAAEEREQQVNYFKHKD